jgi:predicted RNase H-like HicB family nuclease
MVINFNVGQFNVGQSQPTSPLQVTLILERLDSGKVAASIFEFPSCRAEAETKDEAIAQLQATFLERLQHIEAIPWTVPISASEPAWMQFAGVFKMIQIFWQSWRIFRRNVTQRMILKLIRLNYQ